MAQSAPAKDRFQLFISYARRDMPHADAILAALKERDFDVRIDKRNLEPGAKWREELLELIRTSDTVVWLVTPASQASQMCQWELEQCVKLSRRIVPVMVEAVPIGELPIELQSLQFMPSIGVYDQGLHLEGLVETLNKHLPWLKEGTRLADRAHQWNLMKRPNGLLLSRAALKDAEDLLARRPPKAPEPAAETLDYLLASRRRAGQMQRWAIGGSLAVAAVAGVLATIALVQRQAAVEQRDAALVNKSRLLADAAYQQIRDGDAATGILLALEGLPNAEEGKGRPDVKETQNMLLSGLLNLRERSVSDIWGVAAVSADGLRIAHGTPEGMAEVIDIASGNTLLSLAHDEKLTSIGFSDDGFNLVTMAYDGVIRIWDLTSGTKRVELKGFAGFNSVSLSPDGSRLLLANGAKAQNPPYAAMVWDSQSQKRTLLLTHPKSVQRAIFSPDGLSIATADAGNVIRVFNAVSGAQIASLSGHEKPIFSLAISGDGTRLVSASEDGTARLWNLADGSMVHVFTGHGETPWTAGLSRDGTRVFTIRGGSIKEWDAGSGHQMALIKGYIKASMRTYVETESSVEPSQASGTIISTHTDDTARLWTTAPPLPRSLAFDCHVFSDFFISGDGARITTACGGKIQSWDAANGKLLHEAATDQESIVALLLSSGERILAALDKEGRIRLWTMPDLNALAVLEQGTTILSGAFDAAGNRLAAGSPKGVVKIWNLTDLRPGQGPNAPLVIETQGNMSQYSVTQLAFSPAGSELLTLSGDLTPRLWDAATGKLIRTFSDPDHSISKDDMDTSIDCAFTPDGRYAVTTYRDGEAEFWETGTGKRVERVPLSGGTYIAKLAFSPDSRRLISNAESNPVTASEVPSGRLLTFSDFWMSGRAVYETNSEIIAALDNATSSDVPSLKLLDARTFREIHSIPGQFDAVNLSADGTRLAALQMQGNKTVLQIWDLPPRGAERIRLARERVPRCLESLQLEQFGLDPAPPRWCISGPDGLSGKPASWRGKWPYQKPSWRTWLEARDRGGEPPWPNIHEHGPEFVRETVSSPSPPAGQPPGGEAGGAIPGQAP